MPVAPPRARPNASRTRGRVGELLSALARFWHGEVDEIEFAPPCSMEHFVDLDELERLVGSEHRRSNYESRRFSFPVLKLNPPARIGKNDCHYYAVAPSSSTDQALIVASPTPARTSALQKESWRHCFPSQFRRSATPSKGEAEACSPLSPTFGSSKSPRLSPGHAIRTPVGRSVFLWGG